MSWDDVILKRERTIRGIRFVLTSSACPEQYDGFVHRNGEEEQVAYVRLRHGCFDVTCPDVMGTTVYSSADVNGDGQFENEDVRNVALIQAAEKIREWCFKNGLVGPQRIPIASLTKEPKKTLQGIAFSDTQELMVIAFTDGTYVTAGVSETTFTEEWIINEAITSSFDIEKHCLSFSRSELQQLFGEYWGTKFVENVRIEKEEREEKRKLDDKRDFVRRLKQYEPDLYEIYMQQDDAINTYDDAE